MDLHEIGVKGWATFKGLGPRPTEQPGAGCLVLMTVEHVASRVLRIDLADGDSFEVTPTRPMHVEGLGWTLAGDLRAGMMLRGDGGPVAVRGAASSAPNQRVLNIEVGLQHTYRVGRSHVLAHNQCADPGLADFVKRLEDAGVKVTGTNVNIYGPGGTTLGEIDVVTEQALIQYKNGPSSARAVVDQVKLNTEPHVSRPVVTFIGDSGRAGARTVNGARAHGVLATNDFEELLKLVK